MKHVYLTWHELEELVSKLIFKLNTPYDLILAVTRGGIIPGGMIAEALKMKNVMTAAVEFTIDPNESMGGAQHTTLSWPRFLQFPTDAQLEGRKILVVDNLLYKGRTLMSVKGRIETAGGIPELAVVHWKKQANSFLGDEPDYYAEITEDFIHYPWQRIDDSDYRVLAHPVMPLS